MDTMKQKNNSDSKTVNFSFHLNTISNFDTIQKIRNFKELGYDSQSDLLRDALIRFFINGNNAKTLKNQKLEQEILHLKLKNQLELKTQHNKSIDEIKEIMKNPSSFKVEENVEGLPCPECAWRTDSTNTDNEQINQITWHIKHFHNRALTEKESEKLSRLLI